MLLRRSLKYVCSLAGRVGGGSLRVVPAAVQPQRAGVPGHVHAGRHAGDTRVRGAGVHVRLHHHTRHGHEVPAHRHHVSNEHWTHNINSLIILFMELDWIWNCIYLFMQLDRVWIQNVSCAFSKKQPLISHIYRIKCGISTTVIR